MLNHIVLIGRLTKDPELKYTPGGKAVANLRLAVDRGTTNPQGEKETDFIDVVVWERQAESVANNLEKGRLIAVQGRLQIRKYETAEGQRREKAEVVANQVKFLDGKKAGETAPGGGGESGSEGGRHDDDDVPF